MVTIQTKQRTDRREHKPLAIGYTEHAILKALLRYSCLTTEQARRVLGYKPGSFRYIQDKLKRLTDEGYCLRPEQQVLGRGGKGLYVFLLAWPGLRYLRDAGEEVPPRFHAGEAKELKLLFLEHRIAVNDVLIALELVCRQSGDGLRLEAMLSERTLKQRGASVTVHEGEERTPVTVTVIPDGWASLVIGGRNRLGLALELDRGSEAKSRWQRKVAALLGWWHGPYQERFAARSLVIAVVTTEGEKRRADLQRWTAAELDRLGQRAEAQRFFFTAAAVAAEDPSALFLAPRWYRPFREQPERLIVGITEGGG